MDFFSNLFNGIGSAASTVGSVLSEGVQKIGSSIASIPSAISNIGSTIGNALGFGGNTASAANAASSAGIPGIGPGGTPNMTMNTAGLPVVGKDAMGNTIYSVNGKPVAINSQGQTSTTGTTLAQSGSIGSSGYQPSTFSVNAALALPRPAILSSSGPTATSSPNGSFVPSNNSNAQVGNPYFDSQGNYIVPKVAFSGLGGSSAGQSFSTPATSVSTTGAPGLAGGSAFSGTLGAAGLGTSSPLNGVNQTEEDKAKQKKIQDIFGPLQKKIDGGTAVPGITPGANMTGGVTTPAFNNPQGGIVSPYVSQPNVTPTGSSPSLQTPSVSSSQNLNDLIQPRNAALNTAHAVAINDQQAVNDSITQNFTTAKQKLDAQYPSDGKLVTDTQEQLGLINGSGDPYGVKAALDSYKAANTNLLTLESQRLDVLKSLSALNQAYTPIIQDIKNNPDLPKGLASRRLTDLNTKQKDVLLGFQNQLQLLNQSIDDGNQAVNRAFNIVSSTQTQADRAQDNARNMLSLLVSTGAIGGMSNTELSQLSQKTGVPLDGLSKARSAANNPEKNIITETSDDGTVRGIDKTSGKTIWTISGAGKSNPSAGGVGASIPGYAQGLVTQLLNRNSGVTFANLPKEDKQLALQTFTEQGLSIPRPLTSQEKNAADQATAGLNAVEQIRQMNANGGLPLTASALTPNASGPFTSLISAGANALDPRLNNYRVASQEAADIITRIRTGAALNQQEISFYQSKLPALGDNDTTIKNKLDQLTGFYLGMSGLPVTVSDQSGKQFLFTDLYDPQQRLGLRRAIDSGYSLQY